jgi:hypothetical protein
VLSLRIRRFSKESNFFIIDGLFSTLQAIHLPLHFTGTCSPTFKRNTLEYLLHPGFRAPIPRILQRRPPKLRNLRAPTKICYPFLTLLHSTGAKARPWIGTNGSRFNMLSGLSVYSVLLALWGLNIPVGMFIHSFLRHYRLIWYCSVLRTKLILTAWYFCLKSFSFPFAT